MPFKSKLQQTKQVFREKWKRSKFRGRRGEKGDRQIEQEGGADGVGRGLETDCK